MAAPYLRVENGMIYLSLKVQPRAQRDEVGPIVGSELKVRIKAPPVDSAANEALLRYLAERLNCPRGALQLIRGGTSRHKTVGIRGLSAEEVLSRLAP